MDKNKHGQGQGSQENLKDDRNREETGKPMQLDDEKKQKPGTGQGDQQHGGQHQGGQGQTGHGQGGSQQGGQKR